MKNALDSGIGETITQVEYPAKIRRIRLGKYPNYALPNHWHDDVEFLVVTSGSLICDVNGEAVHLECDEGIFINSRQVHDIRSENRQDSEYIVVRFHPMLLCATKEIENRFVLPVIENENYPYEALRNDRDWQRSIIDAVTRVYYMRYESTLELGAQSQFFAMWEQIFQHSGKAPAKARGNFSQMTQLRMMISYIDEHYKERVTLEDICAAGNMGKTSCCQLFQKYLNQTPNLYLTMFRLRKGADLLVQTDLPIVDISYEVGFSGASYFAEAFRKHMGERPSAYRKKRRG